MMYLMGPIAVVGVTDAKSSNQFGFGEANLRGINSTTIHDDDTDINVDASFNYLHFPAFTDVMFRLF